MPGRSPQGRDVLGLQRAAFQGLIRQPLLGAQQRIFEGPSLRGPMQTAPLASEIQAEMDRRTREEAARFRPSGGLTPTDILMVAPLPGGPLAGLGAKLGSKIVPRIAPKVLEKVPQVLESGAGRRFGRATLGELMGAPSKLPAAGTSGAKFLGGSIRAPVSSSSAFRSGIGGLRGQIFGTRPAGLSTRLTQPNFWLSPDGKTLYMSKPGGGVSRRLLP